MSIITLTSLFRSSLCTFVRRTYLIRMIKIKIWLQVRVVGKDRVHFTRIACIFKIDTITVNSSRIFFSSIRSISYWLFHSIDFTATGRKIKLEVLCHQFCRHQAAQLIIIIFNPLWSTGAHRPLLLGPIIAVLCHPNPARSGKSYDVVGPLVSGLPTDLFAPLSHDSVTTWCIVYLLIQPNVPFISTYPRDTVKSLTFVYHRISTFGTRSTGERLT